MQTGECFERVRMNLVDRAAGRRVELQLATERVRKIGRDALAELLDRLRARFFLEVHAVTVALVAAFAILPRHRRVVLELVEPRAEKAIAALHLMVEERERQRSVHGLDPKCEAAKLDRERVEIDGVDAAFDDVAAQDSLQARLEERIVRTARQ